MLQNKKPRSKPYQNSNENLLTFNYENQMRAKQFELIKDRAGKEKIRLCRKPLPDDIDSNPIIRSETYYVRYIHNFAKFNPIPPMPKTVEAKITDYGTKYNHSIVERYPFLSSQYLNEVKDEYNGILKEHSMRTIIKRAPKIECKFRFKLPGRSSNYATYLKNRARVASLFLLGYPFVRGILYHCEMEFPKIVINFGEYRFDEKGQKLIFLITEFERVVNADIINRTEFLKKKWFPKIVKMLRKYYRKNVIRKTMWPRALVCINGLINRQLSELKIRTYEHLHETLADRTRIPMLELKLVCYGSQVQLYPSLDEIYATYMRIFNVIGRIGDQLPCLEAQLDRNLVIHDIDKLPIKMNERYMRAVGQRLRAKLKQTYEQALNYLKNFQDKYYEIYSKETKALLEGYIDERRELTEYMEKIQTFKDFITSLNKCVQYEVFDNVLINQSDALNELKNISSFYISKIAEAFVVEHKAQCYAIRDTFREIQTRAVEVPISTEMLLANGEYFLDVRTKQMVVLQEKIQDVLSICGYLVELTTLPTEQKELQIELISTFSNIKDTFELNASLFESYKAQFEEHLLDVTRKLQADIAEMVPKITVLNYMYDTDRLDEYSEIVCRFMDQLNCFSDYISWINKEEKLFKMPITKYPAVEEVMNFVAPFAELVRHCTTWIRYYNVWMDGPFEYLVPSFVEETVDKYYKEFLAQQKKYRTRIKQDMIGNPICKFKGQTEDPDENKHPVPLRLCAKMLEWIKDFRLGGQFVSIMCNPSLRPRHWVDMSEVAGFDITPDAGASLRKILAYGFEDKLESFEIISVSANKELQLQNNLVSMMHEWDPIKFPTCPYKDQGFNILCNLDEIQALLEDHITKSLTMRGSIFVKPCANEVNDWYAKLQRINSTFASWEKVQMNWLYLLPIFSAKDIIAQMPEENRLFVQVDQTYRKYMSMIKREPYVIETAAAPGLLEAMELADEMLESVIQGVNKYLENIRLYFPRFFFLSNDEMLEILSETKDPLRVQPHLNKCFEGITTLRFDEKLDILSMRSGDDEEIFFEEIISTEAAKGRVEKWLLQVQDNMLCAVQNEIEKSYKDYMIIDRKHWVVRWPQMVVLCISQVFWTSDVTLRLESQNPNDLKEFAGTLANDLNDIVMLIRSKDLSNLDRITIKSLIVIDVHAKDVIDAFVVNNVDSVSNFQWLAQLRYYWTDGNILVKAINATVPFANEYLGNSDRLVITPLTDRCYRTLICAYQLHLNGAPEGPAGTGKTETTKDLAKALAVQCKVFNCSDGLDYKAMGKFFKGLASSGAWACFDEFNRIELEVLSVIAQQILCIVVAVRAKEKTFIFEGTELVLNPACYVCITMNPGYAGRSELPDNLKVLFRTVAMMVPDYAMISEITLYSYGFMNARTLAVKIVTTYRLCSEQLSSQNHYDYGMRAVKTVLSACGNIKRAFPDENEDILLLRSLLDVNLAKFLSIDIPLFQGIISDLFPGIKVKETDYTLMIQEFNTACEELNLQPKEEFFTKVIQTFEMMIVRHGFMMVGEPYAGKSSTLQILGMILTRLQPLNQNPYWQKCEYGICNPKAVNMIQLYGAIDMVSNEWTDGIASSLFKGFATDPSKNRKFLIFDGPIDAVWIENMNTVLDDNKKLCLTSGEVITMTHEMSMVFEVMDLAQASPATVSRCGMIYMEPKSLGWEVFFKSWLNTCNPEWQEETKDFIVALVYWTVPDSLTFVRKNCAQLLQPGEINILLTTFSIFQMLIDDAVEEHPEDFAKYLNTWLQAAMIYSVVWGIGGLLDYNSREKFDQFYRGMWAINDENPPPEDLKGKIDIAIPSEGQLAEYLYVFKQKGAWRFWPDVVRRIEPEMAALGLQVPTIDTGRYIHLLELHVKHNRQYLLSGPTGTGKSFYIENAFNSKFDPEKYVPAFIKFTVLISAQQTQDLLISKLVKLKRNSYGPPKKKRLIIFVDDFNLPVKEKYGAMPPIELLRQYFDYKYVYNLKDTTKMFIKDVMFVSASGLPGGSRQDVYPRFLRHFNCFSINNFAEETMFRIFSNILLNGFKKSGHASDVVNQVNQIVNGSLKVYAGVCSNLRPTPTKCHYIFNLRNVSKVCLGCSLLRKESVDTKQIFVKVWFHEILREFYDRLVEEKDQHWLFELMTDCVKQIFNDKMEVAFQNYVDENNIVTGESLKLLLFGTSMDQDSEVGEKRYEEIPNIEAFRKIAFEALDEYNATNKSKMDIVLFSFALQHLNKICRVLSMPAGSALLIGISGSGRQSSTRLASVIIGQECFQPEITKTYGLPEWRDDVKRILKISGGGGKDVTFLLEENQIKSEAFLMDVDSLLNLGEIPNVWAIDERQELLEMVRSAAVGGNKHLDISPLQLFSFFVKQCKDKLHLILCLSPIGASLRTRIRLYPSLVNCCTVDWYEDWPKEALEMIALRFLKRLELDDEVKINIVNVCQHFHITATEYSKQFFQDTGRRTYVTSASYLNLILAYQQLLGRKQNEIMGRKMRYVHGLDTLLKASEAVAIMQKDLNDLQPKLYIMAENSKKMTAIIEKNTIEASIATEQVKNDEIVANAQAIEAETMEKECSKDLAQVVPVLEEALQALNTLKPADITLVKSMKNPPDIIKLVMAAVCVMKGIPPDRINDAKTGRKILDYWGPSKKILGDMGFLQALKDYDKDNIKPEIMVKIRKEFIPNSQFRPHIVAKASSAAEGLCKWIIAIDMYDAVAKVVAPKQAALYGAIELLKETKRFLAEKRALAAELEAKVERLNIELNNANLEKKRTEDEVELCKDKLERATTLINGLGGERDRWTIAARDLQLLYDRLPGDVLISSGIISYLATFTMTHRVDCISGWHNLCLSLNIPCSENFSLMSALGSEVKIQKWQLQGLPQDSFSVENSIIMDNSNLYSLFIDPQKQANKWIKTMEKANRLKILRFSKSDYMKYIEISIEFGIPALIENIYEDIEAPLDPILKKNVFRQGGIDYISLGANVIPMSPNFRLYMTSSMRNPKYLPDIFNKVTVIYFGLTEKGLEDQLLSIVVAKERPDLQELREKLVVESAGNAAMLENVEENILQTLSSSKGDILEDESAIKILDDSKRLSIDISEKQVGLEKTKITIENFREGYKPVASHSATLYYCISELPVIDPMYQFSLGWYINLYIFSVEHANKSKEFEKRLRFLIDAITRNLYNTICRSLFEKDKLLFSFILTTKIMLAKEIVNLTEFNYLLTGGQFDENSIKIQKPAEWISAKIWRDINSLETLKTFNGFVESFLKDIHKWKEYYDSANPLEVQIPDRWHNALDGFQKLIIMRAFRPDKLSRAIKEYVSNEMGVAFVSPPPFDIAKSFEESNCLAPLIFILSADSDPMSNLLSFAEKMGFDKQFESISLGQGQGPIARRLIEEGQLNGSWVCLQNVHLAASWMGPLEQIWESMDIYNTEASFRLWLTSYPSDLFPQEILQNGVKMTNEPPDGLQKGLLRLYQSEPLNDDQFYKGCPGNDKAFTRVLYGICFFHAVIQERKKCGSLGWNIQYGFNESDFRISVEQLKMLLNEQGFVPYIAIRYMTGECNYGGRVTDAWDRRALTTILLDYINESVVDDMGYKFGEESFYTLPRNTEYREVMKYITDYIPNVPDPTVYGLHSNAGITKDLNISNRLIESMRMTQGSTSSQSDTSSETIVLDFVVQVKGMLPRNFDLDACEEKFPFNYHQSMNTVLIQEMQRFNRLLILVRKTCIDLADGLKGIIVMTPDMEEVFNSIIFRKIPALWLARSYPSLKPIASYIKNFIERLAWLQKWFDYSNVTTYWLSGFFFTQAFLTGAMQNFARKYNIPIDTLTFDFEVLRTESEPRLPEDGVYCNGLFIDGARWDWGNVFIAEQRPKILIEPIPVIHFQPLLTIKLRHGTRYECPLYKTSERKGILSTTGHSTNYVLPILLNSDRPKTHWIKRSVALLCETAE